MQRGPLIMEKILVIEDDESIRLELAALLRANGYLPVDKPPCDLALLDINLPGENGYELCRKLRAQTLDWPNFFHTFPITMPMGRSLKWDRLEEGMKEERADGDQLEAENRPFIQTQ